MVDVLTAQKVRTTVRLDLLRRKVYQPVQTVPALQRGRWHVRPAFYIYSFISRA